MVDGADENYFGSTESIALELELKTRPFSNLSVDLTSTLQNATYADLVIPVGNENIDGAGNEIERIPSLQAALSLSYSLNKGGNAYIVARHVGDRWGNSRNTFKLKNYTTIDAGFSKLFNKVTVTLRGGNILNTIGIQEGNVQFGNNIASESELDGQLAIGRFIGGAQFSLGLSYKMY